MIFHLPDPVVAFVAAASAHTDEATIVFKIRDAAHGDALHALLDKALRGGYAVEIKLITYEGTPNMIEQAKARKERQRLRSEADDRAMFQMPPALDL